MENSSQSIAQILTISYEVSKWNQIKQMKIEDLRSIESFGYKEIWDKLCFGGTQVCFQMIEAKFWWNYNGPYHLLRIGITSRRCKFDFGKIPDLLHSYGSIRYLNSAHCHMFSANSWILYRIRRDLPKWLKLVGC